MSDAADTTPFVCTTHIISRSIIEAARARNPSLPPLLPPILAILEDYQDDAGDDAEDTGDACSMASSHDVDDRGLASETVDFRQNAGK